MYNLVFLTKEGGLILGPISMVLGKILDAIYNFLAWISQSDIANIALCITLFTIVVKMLMLPLTIKQQKSAKLTAKMSPELTAINEKYKGKKDEASQMKYRMETQAIYEKYGTNPMAGCLPLLISLPIMFALYRVIYAVPAYIGKVGDMYKNIATMIQQSGGDYAQKIADFVSSAKVSTINISKFAEYKEGVLTNNHLIDVLSKLSAGQWEELAGAFPSIADGIRTGATPIIKVNQFLGGLNILDTPKIKSIAVLVPILAVVTQVIQTKLTMTSQNSSNKKDDAMAASMKSMNVVMPIMSGVICFMIPIGVGLYWIVSAVVQIIQQIFINRFMEKVDVDEMIAKNQEKLAKKREKMGVATGSKMAELAKTNTKAIDNTPKTTADYANLGKKNYSNESLEKGNNSDEGSEEVSTSSTGKSISDYANIMKNRYNKKDN